MDLRPDLDAPFAIFGLPCTVTPPGGAPVNATGVWITLQTSFLPGPLEAQVAEARKILALRGDLLPEIPRGTVIEIAERAGLALRRWRVDGWAQVDEQDLRVVVLPIE